MLSLVVGTVVHEPAAHGNPSLSADEIMQKALDRTGQVVAHSSSPAFTYTKVTITEELDTKGHVKDRKEKVYEASFREGASSLKLLTVNGHPPDEADAKQQAENESNARKLTGPPKSAKPENGEVLLTPELVARYDFTRLADKIINGRRNYQLAFQAKQPGLPENRLIDRLLNRLSGRLYIDVDEFEIAQAEIHLGSEVHLLAGVIGSLKKFAFTMTRTRIADGVWLSTLSTGDFEGRRLLDSMRIKTKSHVSNFRFIHP